MLSQIKTKHLKERERERATLAQTSPSIPSPYISLQIINFTHTHDIFINCAIETEQDRHNLLKIPIKANGWKVAPLKVITSVVRGDYTTTKHLKTNNQNIQRKYTPNSHKISHPPSLKKTKIGLQQNHVLPPG